MYFRTCFLLSLLASSSYAQSTLEGPFNSFEISLIKNELGGIDSMVSNTRDGSFNRSSVNTPGFGINASALGNLVNVVTSGVANTVVINSQQFNTGHQTAIVTSAKSASDIPQTGVLSLTPSNQLSSTTTR